MERLFKVTISQRSDEERRPEQLRDGAFSDDTFSAALHLLKSAAL